MADPLPFDDVELAERATGEPTLHVDVDGFEGPLDLLLELARRQKVDLHRISILALAEQYLVFVEEARRFRLELAADYLVMAAWLAYLKSRLLLPEPPKGDEPSAADLATALALRLRRSKRSGRPQSRWPTAPISAATCFPAARRSPFWSSVSRNGRPRSTICSPPMRAQRQKQINARMTMTKRHVFSLVDAREAVERLLGQAQDWTALDAYLLRYIASPSSVRRCWPRPCRRRSNSCAKAGSACARRGPFAPLGSRAQMA
jgi:segregation and condensation protein A